MEVEYLLDVVASDKFELAGKGDVFVVRLLPNQVVNKKDLIQITFKSEVKTYEVVSVGAIRQSCFEPGAAPAVGILVKPVKF